jgi:hypothetical protein
MGAGVERARGSHRKRPAARDQREEELSDAKDPNDIAADLLEQIAGKCDEIKSLHSALVRTMRFGEAVPVKILRGAEWKAGYNVGHRDGLRNRDEEMSAELEKGQRELAVRMEALEKGLSDAYICGVLAGRKDVQAKVADLLAALGRPAPSDSR